MAKTNNREIEYTLLFQDSFRHTFRLYRDSAYNQIDSFGAAIIKEAIHQCPSVFNKLLTESPAPSQEIESPIQDQEAESQDMADSPLHKNTRVWAQATVFELRISNIQNCLYQLDPTHPFIRQLYKTYMADYKMISVTNPGDKAIRWFRKLSFSDGLVLVYSVRSISPVFYEY